MDTQNTPALPAPTPPAKVRVRKPVSPEIAANVREENEALNATVNTAKAVAQAAVATANTQIATAQEKYAAAMRPILRQLQLGDAELVGTEGVGASTVLVLDVLAPTASEAPNG